MHFPLYFQDFYTVMRKIHSTFRLRVDAREATGPEEVTRHLIPLYIYEWFGPPLLSVWVGGPYWSFSKTLMDRQALCQLAKKQQLQQHAEHPWHNYGMQPGARAGGHAGKNIPSGTLSISKIRRPLCINKENLTLIFLCSDDSLQTVWLRSSLTTQ